MKILFITSRADTGGGPEHLYQLVKGLKVKGYNCFIACPNQTPYSKRYKELIGLDNVFEVPARKFSVSTLVSLYKFIKLLDIKVIHSHGKGAGSYSRLLGILSNSKIVHTFHGFHIGEYGWLKRKLYCIYETLSSVFTDYFIFVSMTESVIVREHLFLSIKNKSNIIYNGVETVDSSGNINAEYDENAIVSVSRYDYQKNTNELILALVQLKKRRIEPVVYLLGDGEGKVAIIDLCNRHDLKNVKILGNVTSPREYYRQADFLVNTSRWEGLPLAPIEAMSEGVPCVLSHVVGNDEVLDDKVDGYYYDSGNVEQLASIIKLFLDDKQLLARLGSNAKQKVMDRFSLDRMVNETVDVYLLLNVD